MNILIVTQYFWPENFRINDLALGLLERGQHVTVLTGSPNYPNGTFFDGYGYFNKQEDYHGVKVLRVPLIPRGKGGGLGLALNYLSFALTASILGPFLCKGKFDLIFVFQLSPVTMGIPALLFKKMHKAPIVFWVQDLWPESLSATGFIKSKKILQIIEHLVRYIYLGCDRILIQSNAFYDSVIKQGVPPSSIYYYPNYAEQLYQPMCNNTGTVENIAIPSGFRVMFAGNIGVAQDFETILRAAELLQEVSDIQWVILGDGSMCSWVKKQISERGLTNTVHLLGRFPPALMPHYFTLADVMLVTLKKDPIFGLTIPSKLQSYLACSKPIVAALDGEGARVVSDAGAGLSCPAEDPEALAQVVLAMYKKSKSQREEMGQMGRKYYEANFDRDMLIDRLNVWMNELAESSRQ